MTKKLIFVRFNEAEEGREYAEIRNEGMDRIMRYNFGMDGYTNNKLLLHQLYHYVITLYTTILIVK